MGALTNQFEGISKAEYEALLREGDDAFREFVRRTATDEKGRYHDPETRRFWQQEEQRELSSGAKDNDWDRWDAWNSLLAEKLDDQRSGSQAERDAPVASTPTGGRDG